ncbi:MAG: hypothetical protein Q8938_16060, partial [Bacteroidota bacterium]|nr:hypothetical protein [Bacteroidota bacterium]
MDIHNLDFNHLKKNLNNAPQGYPGPGATKIALLSDTASQFIVQALQGYAIEFGAAYELFEANYNQIDSQVFDPSSELYRFEPEFVVIVRSTERLLDAFYKEPSRLKPSFAEEQTAHILSLYETIKRKLKSRVIITNFPEIDDGVFGNYANKTPYSFLFQLRKLNVSLMEMARAQPDCLVCDVATLVHRLGYASAFDPKMYINASMVFSLELLPWLAKSIHEL